MMKVFGVVPESSFHDVMLLKHSDEGASAPKLTWEVDLDVSFTETMAPPRGGQGGRGPYEKIPAPPHWPPQMDKPDGKPFINWLL